MAKLKNWSFYEGRCNSVINFCNFSFFGPMLMVFPAVPPVYKPKIRRILSICLTKEEKDWPFTKLTFTLWSYNIFASFFNLKLRVKFLWRKQKFTSRMLALCISLEIAYCETFLCISCGFHIFLCCFFKDKYTARVTNCFIIIKIVHSLSSDWIAGWSA